MVVKFLTSILMLLQLIALGEGMDNYEDNPESIVAKNEVTRLMVMTLFNFLLALLIFIQ